MGEEQRCAMDWYLSVLHQTSEGRLAGATLAIEPATWHIFQNHQPLMTECERQTTKYLALRSYADASSTKRGSGLVSAVYCILCHGFSNTSLCPLRK